MTWADCGCFCVAGELETMCTNVDEAQGSSGICSTSAAASCPEEPGTRVSASYDAPADGAVNCRDIRVWDAIRGTFIDVKACDVEG